MDPGSVSAAFESCWGAVGTIQKIASIAENP